MIPYEDTFQTLHGRKSRVFRFDPPYRLLETLFAVEVRSSKKLLSAAESALIDLNACTQFAGNILLLHLGQQQTVVFDTLAPDGVGDACVLATTDLVVLLRRWHGVDKNVLE